MSPTPPRLSVILVSGDTRHLGERALQSLLHQGMIDEMEIVVVDWASADAPPLAGTDHPSVTVLRASPETGYGDVRALGVEISHAPIVAVFDEHSFVLPGWAEAIVGAHDKGDYGVVGGEEYNASAGDGLTDAAYLEHCARWMPPATRGATEALPTHDSAYKREVLLRYRDRLPEYLTCLPLLFWKLKEDGCGMYIEPDARYMHSYAGSTGALVNHVMWSRLFGHYRARDFGWTRSQRWLRVAASPLLPVYRVARLGKYLLGRRPDRLWTFFYMSPAILLIEIAGVFGETLGIALGAEGVYARYSLRHARGVRLV